MIKTEEELSIAQFGFIHLIVLLEMESIHVVSYKINK